MSQELKSFIQHFLKAGLLVILFGLLILASLFLLQESGQTNLFEIVITKVATPENIIYINENTRLLVTVFILAFLTSILDSSIGMGYGTIMSPSLIFLGVDIKTVVTALLVTEAFNGLNASMIHNKLKNADVTKLKSRDFKIALLLTSFGIVPVMLAAYIGVNANPIIVKSYISFIMIVMGIILLSGTHFVFSWGKIVFFAILGAFNKGISGGGMGPIYTTGQVVSGVSPKHSVAAATMSQMPIDTLGFLTYLLAGSAAILNPPLIVTMFFAGIPGSYIGPHITHIVPKEALKRLVGVTITVLGLLIFIITWVK